MGFLVVPNSPPCIDGNPEECDIKLVRNDRFCVTKFMREMLRSVSKKAIKCTK